MILNGVHRFGFAPVMLTVVVLARQDLGLDPTGIGLLFSVAGSGGLTGAALTPWLRRRIPVGWHMIVVVGLHGLALGLVALSSSIWLLAIGLFVAGLMETMTGIIQVSYRLALIPDALQGRVNSVYRLLSFAAMSFGMVCGGVLIDLYGPRLTLGLVAAWICAMALGAACSGIRTIASRTTGDSGITLVPCDLSVLIPRRAGELVRRLEAERGAEPAGQPLAAKRRACLAQLAGGQLERVGVSLLDQGEAQQIRAAAGGPARGAAPARADRSAG